MNKAVCSLFFHNYYGGHEEWIRYLSEKIEIPFYLFYHVVADSLYNLDEGSDLADRLQQARSGPFLKDIFLRRSPNQGKDIGGKLVLLDAFIRTGLESEYFLFLHDKKSPYKVQSHTWKDKLFRIIDPSFVEKAIRAFDKNKETGLIAPAVNIRNEYDYQTKAFASKNRPQLERLVQELGLTGEDHRYIAGTMFWARARPMIHFFSNHPALDIRASLERGNVMDEFSGTNTHAWERLLSWLIFAQGYTLKGIE